MSAPRLLWLAAVPAPLAAALLVVLALVGLLGVGGSTTASAATPSPSSSATPDPTPTDGSSPDGEADGDGPAVEVTVTEIVPQVLRPTDELVVRATVHNVGDEELSAPVARLRVNRFLQSTRSSLEQWVDQELDETAGTPVRSVPLAGPLPAGASVDVELRVPATGLGLSIADAAWGPRGLSVELVGDGRRQGILRTFVLWMPTEQATAPTRVSVLVPLTGGPVDPTADPPAGDVFPTDETPDATTDDDAASDAGAGVDPAPAGEPAPPTTPQPSATDEAGTAPSTGPSAAPSDEPTDEPTDAAGTAHPGTPTGDVVRRLDAALRATATHPAVSWAVDPSLLAAARSPAAGPAAHRWVQDLTAAALGRDVFTLPSRDPDLAALAHAGGDALGALATASAAAATDPALGSPVRTDLAWPAGDVPDVATVALAARLGASAVVVGDEGLTPEDLTYTPTGRATVPTPTGAVAALVPDEVLGAQLAAPGDATAATAAQRILAETAVVTRERPTEQRHLLVTVDRGWAPDATVATAQVAALATAPWVDLTPLSTLIGAADPGVDRTPLPARRVDAAELTPAAVSSLVRAHAELTTFATVVPDPAELLQDADDAVVAPTAVAWRAEADERSAVVDAVVAELAARRSGVSIVPGSSLLLLSETGRFPLGLRNDLDQDATVQVAVDPASARLVVDGTERIVVPAGSESQARIPFRAIGNGDVVVEVSLLTPEGVPLGPPERFTVRVRADWENVGTAVVAGLLGVALVVGIVRTIRRGQTARRGAGSTPVTEIAALPRDEP